MKKIIICLLIVIGVAFAILMAVYHFYSPSFLRRKLFHNTLTRSDMTGAPYWAMSGLMVDRSGNWVFTDIEKNIVLILKSDIPAPDRTSAIDTNEPYANDTLSGSFTLENKKVVPFTVEPNTLEILDADGSTQVEPLTIGAARNIYADFKALVIDESKSDYNFVVEAPRIVAKENAPGVKSVSVTTSFMPGAGGEKGSGVIK